MINDQAEGSVQPSEVQAPIGFAVQLALVVVAFVLALILSIGGSYALTIQAISNFKAKEHAAEMALHQREEESAVRTGIPTCKAIVKLDDASHGPQNLGLDVWGYGHRLASAIHDVNVTSGCAVLIHELHEGWSIAKITKFQEHKEQQEEQRTGH